VEVRIERNIVITETNDLRMPEREE